jgi:hypothetical protein
MVVYAVPFLRSLQRAPNNTAPELLLADKHVYQYDQYYFFEMRIENPGATAAIGIGLSVCLPTFDIMPGWTRRTYGYHGDDGKKFGANFIGIGTAYGPTFGKGDVIGCAFNPVAGIIFFTKNTEHLGRNLLL